MRAHLALESKSGRLDYALQLPRIGLEGKPPRALCPGAPRGSGVPWALPGPALAVGILGPRSVSHEAFSPIPRALPLPAHRLLARFPRLFTARALLPHRRIGAVVLARDSISPAFPAHTAGP